MSAKLAKLEALVATLEKAAGINPDIEIVRQRRDGTMPEPQTTAALIVERINFKGDPELIEMQRRHAGLALQVEAERRALNGLNDMPLVQRLRGSIRDGSSH